MMPQTAVTGPHRVTIRSFIRDRHADQVDFLAALVKVPSDCLCHTQQALDIIEQRERNDL